MSRKKCAFTGHKPKTLPFGLNEADERCVDLKRNLQKEFVRLIEEEGVTEFISGLSIGPEMYAAEIVLELKARYPHITLEGVIPFESQADKWNEAYRDRYFDLACRCDWETMLQRHYTGNCKTRYYRYLIDRADYVLVVWDGASKELERRIRYAQKLGKNVRVICPKAECSSGC